MRLGMHEQLPPVIKNTAFQKYSKMDQSLFTRFVRLGVPYIELDAQGRARPQIANLYNWRYKALGNMAHVTARKEFAAANAGFAHEFQLIDVPEGVETEPTAYFYQVWCGLVGIWGCGMQKQTRAGLRSVH